ncbi:uncharacterized protein LOC128092606 [Culex pipiens pallens]|uniref:uncharacterized protein LOC128092606 n=1 Tax=Culex pipiens pallens TaxID=42434 RepID=UPI0022AB4379|nr:uncharacterized protein LOC128092606 [Culex pipiens pallens]
MKLMFKARRRIRRKRRTTRSIIGGGQPGCCTRFRRKLERDLKNLIKNIFPEYRRSHCNYPLANDHLAMAQLRPNEPPRHITSQPGKVDYPSRIRQRPSPPSLS